MDYNGIVFNANYGPNNNKIMVHRYETWFYHALTTNKLTPRRVLFIIIVDAMLQWITHSAPLYVIAACVEV